MCTENKERKENKGIGDGYKIIYLVNKCSRCDSKWGNKWETK